MVAEQRIIIPYAPRRQFLPLHSRTQRFAATVAHRRAGKTVAEINDKIRAALVCDKPNPRVAYIAPYYKQAKTVAWQYLKDYGLSVPNAKANESELRLDFPNGGQVRLYGADNPDALRGIYLDDVTLDEYADMNPRLWPEVIRPTLVDRQGKASFIGTPKGRNAFWEICELAKSHPDWFYQCLRASETGIIPMSELEAARQMMTPEQYEQEFECSFDAAIQGAYYGKEIAIAEREGRVGDYPYDPAYPVYTAWDLGKVDATSIWFFQCKPEGLFFIDFYENHQLVISHYCEVLNGRPYVYSDDFVPHDAKVSEYIDGRTRVEAMITGRRKPKLVPMHKELDGINAARVVFGKIHFDAEKCADGLEALRQFRVDFDENRNAFRDTPYKDWTNHAADAFRYACVSYDEYVAPPPPPETKTGFTLDELCKPKKKHRRI